MFCPACRNELPPDARFCGFCGFRLRPILSKGVKASEQLKKVLTLSAEEAAETMPAFGAGGDGGEGQAADAGPAGQTRRASKRFPLRVDVTYNSEHNFYTGFLRNIGSGGLFVATHTPGRLGEEVTVSFTLPGMSEACEVLCEVRWLREYDPHAVEAVPGMGLRFVEVDQEAEAAIELFIRHREPIFFEE